MALKVRLIVTLETDAVSFNLHPVASAVQSALDIAHESGDLEDAAGIPIQSIKVDVDDVEEER
jgi:hypothetical protein